MFGYSTGIGSFYSSTYTDMVINDKVYFAQSEVIKEVAEKPCVIVGRCADYVLEGKINNPQNLQCILQFFLKYDFHLKLYKNLYINCHLLYIYYIINQNKADYCNQNEQNNFA